MSLTSQEKNDIIKALLAEQIADAEKSASILAGEGQQKMQALQYAQAQVEKMVADLNYVNGQFNQATANVEMLRGKMAALDTPPANADTPAMPIPAETLETLSEA